MGDFDLRTGFLSDFEDFDNDILNNMTVTEDILRGIQVLMESRLFRSQDCKKLLKRTIDKKILEIICSLSKQL